MTYDIDDLERDFDRDDNQVERRDDLRFKPRKRPDYFKRRQPVRQGIAMRSNFRTTRV